MTDNPKDISSVGKVPLELVPQALEIHVATAMRDGALKYGPFNWREDPVKYTVYLAAMKRHIAALLDGEDLTRDGGVHHLAAVGASCAILLDAMGCDTLIDDRSKGGPAADLLEELHVPE